MNDKAKVGEELIITEVNTGEADNVIAYNPRTGRIYYANYAHTVPDFKGKKPEELVFHSPTKGTISWAEKQKASKV